MPERTLSWIKEKRCPRCGAPLITDGDLVWCSWHSAIDPCGWGKIEDKRLSDIENQRED